MPKPIQVGRKERMSFGKIDEVWPMPDLIAIQTNSYKWFVEEGLKEVLEDISPIKDYAEKYSLEFVDYKLSDKPKYSQEECKERDITYEAPLTVSVRLKNSETGEITEQEYYMGDFPLMTEQGTFIYNGAERVVVTQLVRSPGPYFDVDTDKSNNRLYNAQIIPNRGAWIECDTDSKGVLYARVDKTRKQPLTVLVRALGIGTNDEILALFGEDDRLLKTMEKDPATDEESGLKEMYKKLKPGEPPDVESARSHINSLFYDDKRYDLSHVGRYKYNKKLGISNRIANVHTAEDVIDPNTGEIMVEAGGFIDRELAKEIENAGVDHVMAYAKDENDVTKVIGNNFVKIGPYIEGRGIDIKEIRLNEQVYYPVLKEILDQGLDDDALKEALIERKDELSPKHIIVPDVIAAVSYILNLNHGVGQLDDIDHLGNRRLRTVGELLQNQFRIGLSRVEKNVREKLTTDQKDKDKEEGEEETKKSAKEQPLININPIKAAIKEFFGSSQLSQFMDQNNPLAGITHKRRISALGPGGLTRERAGFEVRDIHHSHYGRMCPIETPEGPNIGLIGSLTIYGIVNEYGFIETPYRIVDKKTGVVTDQVEYLTADEEELKIIAQANEPLDENGRFVNEKVAGRGIDGQIALYPRDSIDMMDVSPKQVVSVATAMIPFLEHDDANRALMGSNMQRQAVPLLVTEAPVVGTGMEYKAAKDSGVVIMAKAAGKVEFVDAKEIRIRRDDDGTLDTYELLKFRRSNQGTCIDQRPIVMSGEHVEEGEAIADGPSTNMGEISLGKNLLIGFMTWEGYNYEDAIVLNEKLVINDVLTSIHIVEYEVDARDTKLGPEEITKDIPNVRSGATNDLDDDGIIRVGAEVSSTDILVGKVTPKGENDLSPEEKFLRAIFGEKAREVRDTSLRVPHGETGIVVAVRTFTKDGDSKDILPPGVNMRVRCRIATKRKIQVGDKMSGRHGNKGVVSRILPEEDMPFLEDGTPLQVMLNPLGVPSRMNVGQVLEVHLGLAAMKKGWYIATPVFDGASWDDISKMLIETGYYDEVEDPETGKKIKKEKEKLRLRDGRTGEYFENPVTVGYMYMLKLHHLVDDKIHARATGPYSLVTQQPLGGKAQFGGQRFGEMEVWALEAYGAAYTLQEILTVKSDDIVGRVNTYEAIVNGKNIPEPGIPESFKVLIKELQSLALDVSVRSEDDKEIEFKEMPEYEPARGIDSIMRHGNVNASEDTQSQSFLANGFVEEAVPREVTKTDDQDDLVSADDAEEGPEEEE